MANPPKQNQDSVWAGLAEIALFVMTIVGALRVYGAITNRLALLDGGLTSAQLNYLVVYGILQAIISLAGLFGMRLAAPQGFAIPWVAVALNIAGYWLERLLVWAPDQRSGNVLFMLLWHGLWLALMAAFTVKPTIKETDGTRN